MMCFVQKLMNARSSFEQTEKATTHHEEGGRADHLALPNNSKKKVSRSRNGLEGGRYAQ